jgi:hypothetical protein
MVRVTGLNPSGWIATTLITVTAASATEAETAARSETTTSRAFFIC